MTLIIKIKVVPSSGRFSWKLEPSGQLKCYLKSPAQEGKANAELLNEIAAMLKIPRTCVQLLSGAQYRIKVIRIAHDITEQQFLEKIGVWQGEQRALF